MKGNFYLTGMKVALISKDEAVNEALSQLEKRLTEGRAEVLLKTDLSDYAGYYAVQDFAPELTLFVDKGTSGVHTVKIANASDLKKRDTSACYQAAQPFLHELRMRGEQPESQGVYKPDWNDVKYWDWYWRDKSPMLYVRSKLDADQLADALYNGVLEFGIARRKEQLTPEKEECCGLKGAVSRG